MFLEFPGERRFEINNAEENECRASGTRARARVCVLSQLPNILRTLQDTFLVAFSLFSLSSL